MIRDVNYHLSHPYESEGIGGSTVMEIISHDWKLGHLHLKVWWSSNETTWEHLKDIQEDYPNTIVWYIVRDKVSW